MKIVNWLNSVVPVLGVMMSVDNVQMCTLLIFPVVILSIGFVLFCFFLKPQGQEN